ncbi:MAG: response regulator [Desulfobacterales bacterium]
MGSPLKFFIVDDDRIAIKMHARYLAPVAASVSSKTSATEALQEIIAVRPDCVLLDLMMPGLDGLSLLRQLRQDPSLSRMCIIVVSSKAYASDRQQAMALGADGYIVKPVNPDHFCAEVLRIVEDRIELTFWGVHGTLPVPGPYTVRYGGNTNCVSLSLARGTFMVLDAGTGIKVLSDHLMASGGSPTEIKIFISHPHWDHINGLPFFAPLYVQGNDIEIYGPAHGGIGMRALISGQMDGIYFPINIKKFAASVTFHDLREETFSIDDIQIRTMLLNHPGHCLGYRFDYRGRSVCYLTDNEIYPEGEPRYNPFYLDHLSDFVRGADALITDCTYTDTEYLTKIGWGHSSISAVVAWAHRAAVKTLYLYHHDPSQNDQAIDAKLALAQSQLATLKSGTHCVAPAEMQRFLF